MLAVMIAVAWATLGVLAAAVFGMFAALLTTNASLNQRIDALDARFGARIDALGERLDNQTGRIDVLTATLEDHLRRTAG